MDDIAQLLHLVSGLNLFVQFVLVGLLLQAYHLLQIEGSKLVKHLLFLSPVHPEVILSSLFLSTHLLIVYSSEKAFLIGFPIPNPT